jgi:hypothetical protein
MINGKRSLNLTSKEIALLIFNNHIKIIAHENHSKNFKDLTISEDSFFEEAYRPYLDPQQMKDLSQLSVINMLKTIWKDESPELLHLIPLIEELHKVVVSEINDNKRNNDTPSSLIYQMW